MTQKTLIRTFTKLVEDFGKEYFDHITCIPSYLVSSENKIEDLKFEICASINMGENRFRNAKVIVREYEANTIAEDFYVNDDVCAIYDLMISIYQNMLKLFI